MAIKMTRAEYEATYGKPPLPIQVAPTQEIVTPKKPLSNKISDFFGAKGLTDLAGASIAKAQVPKEQKDFVSFPSTKEVVGSAIQTGANFIPGAGVGAKLGTKVATGLGTGYAFGVGSKMQADKSASQIVTPGVETAIGGTLPIAGAGIKIGTKLVGRLLKGLGSGLSGVSTKTIDSIVQNPETAKLATEKLAKNGNSKLLEENARQIVNGISKVRQDARKAFGQGLEQLSEADIKPKVFRDSTSKFLDKYGYSTKANKIANVEFTEPKNIAKAKELVSKLNTVKLDGKSLRKLADDIENSAYKVATSDERLSFNAFIKDLSSTVKEAVSNSTDKLGEINKQFSNDMQLTEAVENIFGKVNYKNLPEVVKASQKLEGLFAQKGLAPDVVDDFLRRIGISPEDFRTTEAVRQISDKTTGANTKGLSLGEMAQQATSAVITPQLVRDVARFTGLAERTSSRLLNAMSPAARKVLLNAAVQGEKSQE